MTRRRRDLGDGVWQLQADLWQTNCLLAVAGGEVLLCDPSYTREELDDLRLEVDGRRPSATHVLVTHADYDHVCGLGLFREATVVAAVDTAARVEDGSAVGDLRAAGEEWGIDWPLEGVRVDRQCPPGEAVLGAFRIDVVAAPSHGRDGAGFVLLDQGILYPGDHLSAITIPLLAGSLDRAIAANEALLEALRGRDLRWVVPGHGPALTPAEAVAVGEADLAYLRALQAAASEAADAGLSPGRALLHVYAVEPPRASTPDFEIYGIRAGNAQAALAGAHDAAPRV